MFPLLGGLLTGGASLLGSMFSSNTSAQNTQAQIQASEHQQATQNQFTEQMSNTAYQRASKDMQEAGLNPMMMFGSGSAASTPSGSSIQAPMPQNRSPWSDLGTNVSKGLDAMVTGKSIEKMTEEIANLKASEALRKSEDITERMRPSAIAATIGQQEAQTRNIRAGLPITEDLATSAKNRLGIQSTVRKVLDQSGFAGGKVDEAFAPASSFLSTAKGIKSLRPQRSTTERSVTRSKEGESSFEERFHY